MASASSCCADWLKAVLKVVEKSVLRAALGEEQFDSHPKTTAIGRTTSVCGPHVFVSWQGLGKLGKGPPKKLRPDMLRTLAEDLPVAKSS